MTCKHASSRESCQNSPQCDDARIQFCSVRAGKKYGAIVKHRYGPAVNQNARASVAAFASSTRVLTYFCQTNAILFDYRIILIYSIFFFRSKVRGCVPIVCKCIYQVAVQWFDNAYCYVGFKLLISDWLKVSNYLIVRKNSICRKLHKRIVTNTVIHKLDVFERALEKKENRKTMDLVFECDLFCLFSDLESSGVVKI